MMTAPVQYGAQPNLAFYSKPDGPADNWFELLPRGDIAGARAAIDEAMDHATKDFIYVGEGMLDAGADGMDFDTTGGAGDADFFSTLRAVKHLREKYPDAGIEVGMAGEFVIGVHGELEWEGRRLAGLWPSGAARGLPGRRRHHLRAGGEHPHRQELRLERRVLDHGDQAGDGRRAHPGAPQCRRGRRRRAGQRVPARGRGVAGGQGSRRHPQVRRVVGGVG